jgi:hypothetical protein
VKILKATCRCVLNWFSEAMGVGGVDHRPESGLSRLLIGLRENQWRKNKSDRNIPAPQAWTSEISTLSSCRHLRHPFILNGDLMARPSSRRLFLVKWLHLVPVASALDI